jgi:hypothetical protein
MTELIQIISYFLPESILNYFDITSIEQGQSPEDSNDEALFIHLDEKNNLPAEYNPEEYESKGFMQSKQIQDFPIRGKAVFLLIRRRLWRRKDNHKEVVKSGHIIECKGVKLTTELAAFLKEAGYDLRRSR